MIQGYFDKIYVLNQETRADRWKQFQDEAARVGITKHERILSLPADQPYQSFCLSQQHLLKTFLDSGGVNLLALEDDVIFKGLGHFEAAMQQIGYAWDILYLGVNVLDPHPERISNHIFRIRAGWATHAVAYSRAAAEYIVSNYQGWEQDGMYDDWLSRKVLPNVNAYVISPMVAWQRPGYSDLWSRPVEYGWVHIDQKLSEL